jgi:hypothetical protein
MKYAYQTVMIGLCEVCIWLIAFVYGIDKQQVDYLKKLGARRFEWERDQSKRAEENEEEGTSEVQPV